MAFGLRFTDGTTTVTLSSTSVGYVLSYKQGAAARSKPTVTDKVEVLLVSNLVTVQATMQSLNRLFQQAEVRVRTGMGSRVYVERDLGDSTWWRGEITEAMPLPDDRTFDLGLASGKIPLELIFTRKNYWEGAEAQCPLYNGNGTNNTTGLTVYNHDDAGTGHDNWVSIAASAVSGDLPGPARLELTNTFNDTDILGPLWIGQNWTDPGNYLAIYEAEDATGGTDVADASCSGGYYSQYALASGSETTMYTWTVSTAALNAARGGQMRGLVRFYSGLEMINVWFRLKLKWGGNIIWQSERSRPSSIRNLTIRDLFSFRLPPWLPDNTGLDDIEMILSGYQVSGSNITVKLDFLAVIPADGWRYLDGGSLPYNSRLIDDAIIEQVYIDDGAGTNKIGLYKGYGSQIYLQPDKLQRLYFLQHSASGGIAEIERTLSVKVYYRPRRLTL